MTMALIKKAMGFAPMAFACSKQNTTWVRVSKVKIEEAVEKSPTRHSPTM
jgi:hypothetical protein